MDRLPRDQSLRNRIEHKKAQLKSQLAPGQHHLVDDLVDLVVEQVNQDRDVATVCTGSAQSPRQETQSTATSDPNCSSREQSIPLVVSTPQPQSSPQSTSTDMHIKQEEQHSNGQTAVLFGPIKTEFESSSSSSSESNSAVPIKQEFKEEIKEELEEKIDEHSDDDDDCDCSECELELKRKMDSEDDDDDQPNTERAVKRQKNDEQMYVQDGTIQSIGGDGGGEGDLDEGEQVGSELINQEQMMDDDGDNMAPNQMDRADGDEQIDVSRNGQMENVNGDRDNVNRPNQAGTSAAANQQVTLPVENFVKQIEPDQFGNRFECDYESCGKRMKHERSLIRHIQVHIGSKDRSVNGPSSQGRTLRTTEPTPTLLSTPFEPIITETEHCVKTVSKCQWSRKSTITTYQCRNYGDCTHVTKSLKHLRDHQRTHSGVKPFKCSVSGCEFTAGLKGSVREHVKKVHFPNLKKDSTFFDRYIETDEQLLNSNPT